MRGDHKVVVLVVGIENATAVVFFVNLGSLFNLGTHVVKVLDLLERCLAQGSKGIVFCRFVKEGKIREAAVVGLSLGGRGRHGKRKR